MKFSFHRHVFFLFCKNIQEVAGVSGGPSCFKSAAGLPVPPLFRNPVRNSRLSGERKWFPGCVKGEQHQKTGCRFASAARLRKENSVRYPFFISPRQACITNKGVSVWKSIFRAILGLNMRARMLRRYVLRAIRSMCSSRTNFSMASSRSPSASTV